MQSAAEMPSPLFSDDSTRRQSAAVSRVSIHIPYGSLHAEGRPLVSGYAPSEHLLGAMAQRGPARSIVPLLRAGCRTRLLLAISTGSSSATSETPRVSRRPHRTRVKRPGPSRSASTRLQTDRTMSGRRRKRRDAPLTSPPLGTESADQVESTHVPLERGAEKSTTSAPP
jgi:hypothetical protein